MPTRRVPEAFARMALDRRHLRGPGGPAFAKLLGTGSGRTFTPRDADLRRWGLLAVWAHPGDADAFEGSPTVRAWGRIAGERWQARLRPVSARGRWSGRTPFGDPQPDPQPGPDGEAATGPVAAITRARLVARRAPSFWRSVPPVSGDLAHAAGLRFAIGIGEAPVNLQGTFSVWDDARALRAFAYGRPAHTEVVRRTAERGWYAEELFARFTVLATVGTVDGRDPAGL